MDDFGGGGAGGGGSTIICNLTHIVNGGLSPAWWPICLFDPCVNLRMA